ncbi:MAG: hypothetical protein AAGA55_10390 [Planctomycetota bacterium]
MLRRRRTNLGLASATGLAAVLLCAPMTSPLTATAHAAQSEESESFE